MQAVEHDGVWELGDTLLLPITIPGRGCDIPALRLFSMRPPPALPSSASSSISRVFSTSLRVRTMARKWAYISTYSSAGMCSSR